MLNNRPIVCIIPARGNSKRLKGKNIISFLGKPLIAHSIEAAKKSAFIDGIFVSTDNEDIADISRQFGADVIYRPSDLSTDTSTTASAIKHALLQSEVVAVSPSVVITLQPSSPLRPRDLIDDSLHKFFKSPNNPHSLISVSLNKLKLGKLDKGLFRPITYQTGQRSQDLQPYYFENGLIYITKSEIVLQQEDLFGDKIETTLIEGPFCDVDIDDQNDLEWAEFLGKKHINLL